MIASLHIPKKSNTMLFEPIGVSRKVDKITDRVIRTTLKNGGELKCSGRVGSSCSTSGTRRVNLITNLVNFNAPFFPLSI
jgi:hypothetical protein